MKLPYWFQNALQRGRSVPALPSRRPSPDAPVRCQWASCLALLRSRRRARRSPASAMSSIERPPHAARPAAAVAAPRRAATSATPRRRASSSSPTITARNAPLASARRNCALNPPPPQCSTTSSPASRSRSAAWSAGRAGRVALVHDVDVALRQRRRRRRAPHQFEHPLDADRETAGRRRLAPEHLDQRIVAPAAADGERRPRAPTRTRSGCSSRARAPAAG